MKKCKKICIKDSMFDFSCQSCCIQMVKSKPIIYFDDSGSISDKELKEFTKEIKKITKKNGV